MTRRTLRRVGAAGVALSLALVTSGCLSTGGDDDGGGGGDSGVAPGEDGDGEVTILGAFGGAEEEAFNASLAAFEDESGIDVQYEPNNDFTTTVNQQVQAGDAPDIGLFPQPGGLLAQTDAITPIDELGLDEAALEESLVPGFLDFTTVDGTRYGAPMRLAVKSVVFYPKAAYEAAGYNTAPATFEELQGIAQEIQDSGIAPWCMGWESDAATGWVGTDWLEEMVLRVAGPDVYDQWVSHEIPFDDPQIVAALDAFGEIALADGVTLGGPEGIVNTPFAEAMNPAFATPPQCMLHRQGNFATGFYPAEVQQDLDNQVGVFYFPPLEGSAESPVLVGGDIAAAFNGDDEDTQAVMEFLTSAEFGGEWAGVGGWLSPHTTFDATQYPNETTRAMAEIAANADVLRFDASDIMPREVGSGTFWTEMVEWVSGKSTEDTLAAIEESWPAS